MNTKRQRSSLQVNSDNFERNAVKRHRDEKYKMALKGATKEYDEVRKAGNLNKQGYGIGAIVEKWNESHLWSPNDRQLKKSTVHRAVARGNVGKSPPKIGSCPRSQTSWRGRRL